MINRTWVGVAPLVGIIALAQPAIFLWPWGAIPLGAVIIATLLLFPPKNILHPSMAVFAFYFLWLVIPSSLSLLLDLIRWEYVLPWGQLVVWNGLSGYTLLQIEMTFLTLYLSCLFFVNAEPPTNRNFLDTPEGTLSISDATALYLSAAALTLAFLLMHLTGGGEAWLTSYSRTYLMGREGLGALNLALIVTGNLTVFLLGLRNYARRGGLLGLLPALIVILPLGYVGGFKSRLLFLLFLFILPYVARTVPRIGQLAALMVAFIVTFYLLTLVRSSGFYAAPERFLEMMAGYFNSYPLHDRIVTSRDPAFFQTVFQVFVKPMQYLGWMSPDADFDISVMLTKEFFFDQWNLHRGTQQWPIETDLYLNYYGVWFQWIPLMAYAALLSVIYRSAIIRQNYAVMPIYALEFLRIFSKMRGSLIPWDTPILIVQYAVLYFGTRALLKPRSSQRSIAPKNAQSLAELAYKALCNERQIDIHFCKCVLKSKEAALLPKYKILKLQVWKRQTGILFWPAVVVIASLIPLLSIAQWVRALAASLLGKRSNGSVVAWATTSANMALIERSLASAGISASEIVRDLKCDARLAAALGLSGVLRCVSGNIRLLSMIVLKGPARLDLFLHARDAFQLLMLAEYAKTNSQTIFITNDHYQRWAFVLSHCAERFWLAQHGFLYGDIEFPFRYGRIERFICRDSTFVPLFNRYFELGETTVLSSELKLSNRAYSDTAVFLVSSSVSIDAELHLLTALRSRLSIPIVVKLHPNHKYDDRASKLIGLADYVVDFEDYPDCRLLVTYNSFLEFEYRALGKATVSIEREGSVDQALQAILRVLT